jgi:hypothetical protein
MISSYKLNPNTLTLNMRLDYFSNSTINQYVRRINNYEFTNKIFDSACENIIFLINPPQNYGIDNIYVGKFYKIYFTKIKQKESLNFHYSRVIHATIFSFIGA